MTTKNYFIIALLSIFIALLTFAGLKNILPEHLFPIDTDKIKNVLVDSMALQAMQESSSDLSNNRAQQLNRIEEIIPSTSTTEGYTNLMSFYSKLHKLQKTKKGKVRIAYFGDSMTDGDFIVQDVRRNYQNEFGGTGVGFVPMTSLSAGSRATIEHKYSSNWATQSFLTNKQPKYPFGLDGTVSFLNSNSEGWLHLVTSSIPHLEVMNKPILFYGQSSNKDAFIVVNTDRVNNERLHLLPTKKLNTIELTSDNTKLVKISTHNAMNIPFYGLNINEDNGVYVDNFSMRGNSGLPLSTLDKDLMKEFDSMLHYDLIVVQYGANLLGHKSSSYDWYEKKMFDAIIHLKECFTNADFLIISAADRAVKTGAGMQTDSYLKPLIESQKNYATNTNSCFINLFSLMGGEGSMITWVKQNPSLATKDYTHFNTRGSVKVAGLIYNELHTGYEKYKTLKQEGVIK